MELQQRINAFVKLGAFLGQFSTEDFQKNEVIEANALFFDGFKHQLKLAKEHNGWFTQNNISFSLNSWTNALTHSNINKWLAPYNFNTVTPKTVAIIMAGNIPLVGFHDFLSVLISGHHVLVKQSSNDKHLLPFLAKYLEVVEPAFKGKITFTEQKLENFDAVIATGSDNTARYFEYYFKGKPSIIRKNRNSVAVLTGKETTDQLEALSHDIFRYYGLGCRNVSKLFVPKDYNFDAFLMIKEDKSYASPIATVFYEYYDTKETMQQELADNKDNLQCVVANGFLADEITFGYTQKPQLWDYADNVDTVEFLLKT